MPSRQTVQYEGVTFHEGDRVCVKMHTPSGERAPHPCNGLLGWIVEVHSPTLVNLKLDKDVDFTGLFNVCYLEHVNGVQWVVDLLP